MNKNEEQYRILKQIVHTFYHNSNEKEKKVQSKVNNLTVEPKLIYDTFNKTLRADFKIGDTQLYKIKNLPEFFERMLNHDDYKYGNKLEFVHTKDAFKEECRPLLDFVLKYAEIIKYANETVGSYSKYMRTMSNEHITISNTGLDEIFDVLKNQKISFKINTEDYEVLFADNNPNIIFTIEQEKNGDYVITPNIDVFSYEILNGKEYLYLLTNTALYRCDKEFENKTLKLLNIYRENYTPSIRFKSEEFPNFCSLIYPKLKKEISLDKLDTAIIDKYIPDDLYVKIYLDYDENNYITADLRFVYGDTEFNPLKKVEVKIARDFAKENEYLDVLVDTGFMLDTEKARLVLADDEKIYNFLTKDIEEYMKTFEILATDNFNNKEIRRPKIGSIGVKIENNLLEVNLSNIEFDIEEVQNIMKKYTLRKKFHRLKDGSFLNLEENETMDFISGLIESEDISYEEIKNGEFKLPISRSMYLDKILQNIDADITKDEDYKKIVNQVSKKEFDDDIELPKRIKI